MISFKEFCDEKNKILIKESATSDNNNKIKDILDKADIIYLNPKSDSGPSMTIDNEVKIQSVEKDFQKVFGKDNVILVPAGIAVNDEVNSRGITDIKIVNGGLDHASSSMQAVIRVDKATNIFYRIKINKATLGKKSSAPKAADFEMGISVAYNLRQITGSIQEKPKPEDLEKAYSLAKMDKNNITTFQSFFDELISTGNNVIKKYSKGALGKSLEFFGSTSPKHIKGWGSSLLTQEGAKGFGKSDVPKTDIKGDKKNQISLKQTGGSQLMSGSLTKDAAGVLYAGMLYYDKFEKGESSKLAYQFIEEAEEKAFTAKFKYGMGGTRKLVREAYVEMRKKEIEKWYDKNIKSKNKAEKNSAINNQINWEMKNSKDLAGVVDLPKKDAYTLLDKSLIPDKGFINKWYMDFLKTQSKQMQNEVQKAIKMKDLEANLHQKLQVIMGDFNYKKWCIFEAATGTYKYSGLLDIDEAIAKSPEADSIANKILVFGPEGTKEYSDLSAIKWSEQYANKVDFKVRVKTGGGSALAISSQAKNVNESINNNSLWDYLNVIIDEELTPIFEEAELLLDWNLKSAVNAVKDFSGKLAAKLTEGFKKIWDRFWGIIKGWADKGLSYMMTKLGMNIEGTGTILVSF